MMFYHPNRVPSSLSLDDKDLIINNYVGTSLNFRNSYCKGDTDILSCAKKLFKANASEAQDEYSCESPIQKPQYYVCDIPFRENGSNPKDDPLTALIADKLFPENNNTARWLCYNRGKEIPTLEEAIRSRDVLLNYYRATDLDELPIIHNPDGSRTKKSPLEIASKRKADVESPQGKERQKYIDEVKQQRESEQKAAAAANQEYVKQETIKIEAERQKQWDALTSLRLGDGQDRHPKQGGLKRKQQSKRKQSKRKQSKRKQSKRKQSKRRA
jgi:hypothetical protein